MTAPTTYALHQAGILVFFIFEPHVEANFLGIEHPCQPAVLEKSNKVK